jgi:hypothetical protein
VRTPNSAAMSFSERSQKRCSPQCVRQGRILLWPRNHAPSERKRFRFTLRPEIFFASATTISWSIQKMTTCKWRAYSIWPVSHRIFGIMGRQLKKAILRIRYSSKSKDHCWTTTPGSAGDCHLDKFWWTFKQPCDLDGTAWHKPVAPASRHDRARSALELRNASPCRPRYRLGTAAHSQAVLQSGRE